jgi:hypothetical protein
MFKSMSFSHNGKCEMKSRKLKLLRACLLLKVSLEKKMLTEHPRKRKLEGQDLVVRMWNAPV